mgnify:CR=1
MGVSFDRVLAFEKNLLEPADFWGRVPLKWQPFWNFYNIPINSSAHSAAASPSPLFHIRTLAAPEDFVSLKLDIDFPDIEIRLAQEIATNVHNISSLIDEFFFEVHFKCDIMTQCGWRSDLPDDVNGFPLDRLPVMQFFQELRRKGIRSHFWP